MAWYEKTKEDMEDIGFSQSQVYPCVWYREYIVLLFYVDSFFMISLSKDKLDDLYAFLQEDFKIEYDRDLNKYIGIYLDGRSDGSIHMIRPYLAQRIINMIPGMYESSNKSDPAVNLPLSKNEGDQARKKL